MIWLQFIASAAVIVYAATRLAKYGDVIATRTKLGGMFVGILLLAAATSLPELLTTISSLSQGVPNLAAGNLLGSNMFNMLLLAVIDLTSRERILRQASFKHALNGSLTVLMITLVVFFILAQFQGRVAWIGLDSIVLIGSYVFCLYLIQRSSGPPDVREEDLPENYPSLKNGLTGFALAAAALAVVTPLMVSASADIAEVTGLGTSFVGTTLVALVTSLPEVVTALAAIRIGAADMAIGNVFGSNMFNMFALGLTDLFYTQGNFISSIDPSFLLIASIGLLMTVIGLVGNVARIERRVLFLEIDALALMVVYGGGLWLLYSRGVAP